MSEDWFEKFRKTPATTPSNAELTRVAGSELPVFPGSIFLAAEATLRGQG